MYNDCFGDCGGVGKEDCAGVCYYDWVGPVNTEDACGTCNGSETDSNNCP